MGFLYKDKFGNPCLAKVVFLVLTLITAYKYAIGNVKPQEALLFVGAAITYFGRNYSKEASKSRERVVELVHKSSGASHE